MMGSSGLNKKYILDNFKDIQVVPQKLLEAMFASTLHSNCMGCAKGASAVQDFVLWNVQFVTQSTLKS